MSPSRRRFAEVVRSEPVDLGLACLLVGGEVEPGLVVDDGLAVLDSLAAAARRHVPRGCPPRVAAEGLRVALGEQAGFAGFATDYDDLRSSLLHEVLRRGRGLPLTLSVVWLEVAARLDVPAYPVGLPGHLVVGIGDPDDAPVLVDPFAGGRALPGDLARETDPNLLRPMRPDQVLLRLLTNVRALAARQPPGLSTSVTRLWATDLSLLLPRHPVELRRERGELLVRLGEHLAGAEELETFALVVEDADPEAATRARRDAGMARAQLN